MNDSFAGEGLKQRNKYSLHFHIQGHYQNYSLQLYKATNTNQDKINDVCLMLAKDDISYRLHACGNEKVGFHAPH